MSEALHYGIKQQYDPRVPLVDKGGQTCGSYIDKPVERQPQIVDQLNRLSNSLSYHRETISLLETRLSGALSLESPNNNKQEKLPEPTCTIAAILQEMENSLITGTAILSSILRRIEL